ncbi:MAG: Trm112 family protein [Kofleriaceae bacterium]
MLPNELVSVLVCPKSKQPLIYFPRGEADRDEAEGFLLCPGSRLRYPIQDGVPVLLVEEAISVAAAALDALVARAHQLGLALPAGATQKASGHPA